jgi:hypothetical protein
VAALAGCNQSTPEEDSAGAQSDLKIVEQVQVDESGAEVKAAGVRRRLIRPVTARRPALRCPLRWRAR